MDVPVMAYCSLTDSGILTAVTSVVFGPPDCAAWSAVVADPGLVDATAEDGAVSATVVVVVDCVVSGKGSVAGEIAAGASAIIGKGSGTTSFAGAGLGAGLGAGATAATAGGGAAFCSILRVVNVLLSLSPVSDFKPSLPGDTCSSKACAASTSAVSTQICRHDGEPLFTVMLR